MDVNRSNLRGCYPAVALSPRSYCVRRDAYPVLKQALIELSSTFRSLQRHILQHWSRPTRVKDRRRLVLHHRFLGDGDGQCLVRCNGRNRDILDLAILRTGIVRYRPGFHGGNGLHLYHECRRPFRSRRCWRLFTVLRRSRLRLRTCTLYSYLHESGRFDTRDLSHTGRIDKEWRLAS